MKTNKIIKVDYYPSAIQATAIVFNTAITDLVVDGKMPRISMKYCMKAIKDELYLNGISLLQDYDYYMTEVLEDEDENSDSHIIHQKICKQLTKLYSK